MIQFAVCDNRSCGKEFWKVIDETERKVVNYFAREGFKTRCICPDCANELTPEEIRVIHQANVSKNK